jgi:hypothetical protein
LADITSTPTVKCLLLSGCPATVGRLVVAIVVDTFNSHPVLWLTHIFNESFYRLIPAITDSDASTTVMVVVLIVGVLASGSHRAPDLVGRRVTKTMANATDFIVITATAGGMPVNKCITDYLLLCATVAAHPPVMPAGFAYDFSTHIAKDCQASESLPCEVNKARMRWMFNKIHGNIS